MGAAEKSEIFSISNFFNAIKPKLWQSKNFEIVWPGKKKLGRISRITFLVTIFFVEYSGKVSALE